MISGVYMHYAPCWFPDFVVWRVTLKERRRKIRNEASQKRREKWKRGYFKSRGKALQNGVQIAPILQVTPKLQGFEN